MINPTWTPIDFAAVNIAALPRFASLLAAWLPDGHQHGAEWVALNPTRSDRRKGSFRINIQKGCWADFATGDTGGDPVSLYAYLNGLSQPQAARQLMAQIGVTA
ncbi:hypothetical protein ACFE33_00680 [Falsihalocynthiibacter sp. SS001]|uniref:hypothetical protein n=1 Tax=Falsihalocynthiibacter sp. SS001 TaxID=3349698 RepID=UPI0036D2E692